MPGFLTRGQPAALAAVRRLVERGEAPHALMLAGPPRVGKSTLAYDLAAGLLCTESDAADRPCRRCAACRKVAHGNHPDLHRLAPEGPGDQVRLGQIQALVASLALLPMEGRLRIAVVEAAHRLNQDAQNALLKTLEEPPSGVCLVLAVDDEPLVLPTVKSRCARLRLGPVPREAIADLLVERGLADRPRAAALARLAGGRPGVAFALAAEPEAELVHARLLRSLLDLTERDRRGRLGAVPDLLGDAAQLGEALERGARAADPAGPTVEVGDRNPTRAANETRSERRRPASGGSDRAARGRERPTPTRRAPSPGERRSAVLTVIAAWREVARDVALAARGGGRELRHAELLEELRSAAARLEPSELAAFLERLDRLEGAVESYANPELALDALLLAWPRPRVAA